MNSIPYQLVQENITKPAHIPYGHDYYGNKLMPELGYEILPDGVQIRDGDKPFDIYAGWIQCGGYHADKGFFTESRGRWTTWERKI